MAERPEMTEVVESLQADVEYIWQTLEFNRETIKFLDRGHAEMRPSTDGCSTGTVCTSCSSGPGCVMTVYH